MGKRIELTQVYRKPPATVVDARHQVSRPWPKPQNKNLAAFDAVTNTVLSGLMDRGTAASPLPKSKKPRKAKKAKKTSPAKAKTSPSRKIYLAAKAKERRAAVKAGLSLKDYRIQQGAAS